MIQIHYCDRSNTSSSGIQLVAPETCFECHVAVFCRWSLLAPCLESPVSVPGPSGSPVTSLMRRLQMSLDLAFLVADSARIVRVNGVDQISSR